MAPKKKPQAAANNEQAAQQQNSAGAETEAPPPPPMDGENFIKNRKLQVIAAIQARIADPVWMERLLKIAHGDESKIMRAVNSYSTFIANDQGGRRDNKKYVCEASLSSLFSCFLEAFQLGLDIGGGRDLVSIIVYGNTAELDVTYKGFVNALSRHFDNPFVQFGNIFEGDEFLPVITDTTASFIHTPKNPFTQPWDKLIGTYCYFSYTLRESSKEVSRLCWIDKPGIMMIRSKAKSQNVWNDFWGEMVIKAVIRRASKIPFASIDFDEGEIDPSTVDNKHFLLEDKSAGGDRLSKLLAKQREVLDDDKKPEDKPAGEVTGQEADPAATEGGNTPSEASQGQQAEVAATTKPTEDNAVRFQDAGGQGGSVIDNGAQPVELTDDDFSKDDSNGR